jgi:hypothetical protein
MDFSLYKCTFTPAGQHGQRIATVAAQSAAALKDAIIATYGPLNDIEGINSFNARLINSGIAILTPGGFVGVMPDKRGREWPEIAAVIVGGVKDV